MERRVKGSGSVYQRGDGVWTAQMTIPTPRGQSRVRKTRYASDRASAEAALVALFEEAGTEISVRQPGGAEMRRQRMAEARARGTHTQREWYDVLAAHDHRCHYCGRASRLGVRIGKDHKVPVSRGGSDSIDNIVPACVRCNTSKLNATYVEFVADKSIEQRHADRVETDTSRSAAAVRKRLRESSWR